MIKVGVAIGIGVGVFLGLCCLWWGARKLRAWMKEGKISATLEEILVERRKGVKKDVVRTFPIVETSELNFDTNSKLQCPICWLQFRDTDTIRQLPHCDHVFHQPCIDPILEQQITCPVCGTILTDNPKTSEEILSGKNKKKLNTENPNSSDIHSNHDKLPLPPPYQQQIPLRSLYSQPSSPKAATTPSPSPSPSPPPPAWVLVNRPVPLPRTTMDTGSSSSDRFEIELNGHNPSDSYGGSGESPLLLKFLNGSEDWHSEDIEHDQQCIDISFTFGTDIPVEKRQPANPSVDSFSFSTTSSSSSRRSRGKDGVSFSESSNPSSRFSRTGSWSRNSSSDSGSGHLLLTRRPDECAFDVMPVVTGPGSYAWQQGNQNSPRVGTNRKTYAQL